MLKWQTCCIFLLIILLGFKIGFISSHMLEGEKYDRKAQLNHNITEVLSNYEITQNDSMPEITSPKGKMMLDRGITITWNPGILNGSYGIYDLYVLCKETLRPKKGSQR